jgi:hypothetical protein
MSEPVKCDGCGATGLRSLRTPCPADWWYLVSKDEGGNGDYYVFACSISCRQGLWQKGPGPVLPGAAHTIEILKGNIPLTFCAHTNNEITQPCPCPPNCYCKQHTCRVAVRLASQAMFCSHANEVPSTCPCPDYCYCKSHSCRG